MAIAPVRVTASVEPLLRTRDESHQAQLPLALSAELLRRHVAVTTPRATKSAFGQFMTPEPVARFMAAMFRRTRGPFALVEPGAGLGALATAALGGARPRLVSRGLMSG